MTVCVAIKVHDCIVFAADSAVSLSQNNLISHIWNHGYKVFNLHRELPVAAMTAGLGQFGPASISNLTKDFRIQLQSGETGLRLSTVKYSIEHVATLAHNFFSEKYRAIDPKPSPSQSFDFWIGGYGSDGGGGEIWKILIQDGEIKDPQILATEKDERKLVWGGQGEAINRLIFGFGKTLLDKLIYLKIPAETIKTLLQQTVTPLVQPSMPVQDTIDLADFLVDMTKKYSRFLPGANTVGGDTDIATVTKHEGFKWIKRKHYYPEALNRKDIDHAGY